MKKYKFKLSILLVLSILFGACDNWLEVLPQNKQSSDTYWTSKEEVEAVVSSGYIYLRTCVYDLIELGEVRGSCIYDQTTDASNLQSFQLTPSDDIADWSSFYKVIGMANSVLANAEDVLKIDETFEESVMKSYLVEAYFLRALSYFYIVRNWRDAPLVLTPYEDDQTNYEIAKSSETEILEQIKSDIDAAIETGAAKANYSENWETKGRATEWSLYALMADVCLWTEDYTQAIIYCNKILEASSSFHPEFISTPSKWYEIFYPGNSNESIFEIQYNQKDYDQTNTLAAGKFGNSAPKYVYTDQMLQDYISETTETGIDDAIRTIYGGYLPNTDEDEYDKAYIGYAWKYSGIGITDQNRNTTDEQDPNYIIYRVADIMLMKAEAMVLSNNSTESWSTAVDLINEIRTRSNLLEITPVLSETSEEEMLEYILDERRMELATEGKRWYDLLRFGKRNDYQYRETFLINEVIKYNVTANSSWIRSVLSDDDALYLPIHKDEIESNSLLEQNPYYDIVD